MSKLQPTYQERVDGREEERHPSFVTVQFSHISGSRSFFGSSVNSQHWIRLSIHEAYRYHDLGRDVIHGSVKELVTVDLSPSQFAQLLTTMNHGSGTPGTLCRMNGKQVEEYEETTGEAVRVSDEFKQEMETRAAGFVEARDEVLKILQEKKTISKGDRDAIGTIMNSMVSQFRSSMPFYFNQFQEAIQKTVDQAKAEVDAFATHVIQRSGIAALHSGEAPRMLLALKEKEDAERTE